MKSKIKASINKIVCQVDEITYVAQVVATVRLFSMNNCLMLSFGGCSTWKEIKPFLQHLLNSLSFLLSKSQCTEKSRLWYGTLLFG